MSFWCRVKPLLSTLKLRQALGSGIRDRWIEAPEYHQALITFEDLAVGDRFILYPEPNRKLSYRGAILFIKIKDDGSDSHALIFPGGKYFGLDLSSGDKCFFANENAVLRIIDRPTSA